MSPFLRPDMGRVRPEDSLTSESSEKQPPSSSSDSFPNAISTVLCLALSVQRPRAHRVALSDGFQLVDSFMRKSTSSGTSFSLSSVLTPANLFHNFSTNFSSRFLSFKNSSTSDFLVGHLPFYLQETFLNLLPSYLRDH